MPVHEWTRVDAGIFHHFHQHWIGEISDVLNAGLLPGDYYALDEQVTGDFGPDVLALQIGSGQGDGAGVDSNICGNGGRTAVAAKPPQVQYVAQTDMDQYVQKQSSLVIRHTSGDRIVALVEAVSPGNKSSRHNLRSFVDKAATFLFRGYHLLVLDLQPPSPRDPNGIHGAIWEEIADSAYRRPPDKPLTLAAYDAGSPKTAYVQPVAVGDVLPEMPLFLEPGEYVAVPLEATYQAAWKSVPARWRRILEA